MDCAKEVEETNKCKKSNGHSDLICKGCLESLAVKGDEHTVSLGKKLLFWFICPEYLPLEFSALDTSNDMETEPMQHELLQTSKLVTIDINETVMVEEGEDNSVDTAPTKKVGPNKSSNKKTEREKRNFSKAISISC